MLCLNPRISVFVLWLRVHVFFHVAQGQIFVLCLSQFFVLWLRVTSLSCGSESALCLVAQSHFFVLWVRVSSLSFVWVTSLPGVSVSSLSCASESDLCLVAQSQRFKHGACSQHLTLFLKLLSSSVTSVYFVACACIWEKKGLGGCVCCSRSLPHRFSNQSMQHIIVFFLCHWKFPFPPPIIRTVFPETIRRKVIWKRSLHVDFL